MNFGADDFSGGDAGGDGFGGFAGGEGAEGAEGAVRPTDLVPEISEAGWSALSESDRASIIADRKRFKSMRSEHEALRQEFAEMRGLVEGLKAGGGGGKPPAKREVSDFSDEELNHFLREARSARAAGAAAPEDEAVQARLRLLGDGSLEDEARIELAARRAAARNQPALESLRAERAGEARGAAMNRRVLEIVGPKLMSEMVGPQGVLRKDHPVVEAAYERAQQFLADRQIDPKNSEAVGMALERAFEEVVGSRGGGGRESVRGRLELGVGGVPGGGPRTRAAANISALINQGKHAEATDHALDQFLSGNGVHPAFAVNGHYAGRG